MSPIRILYEDNHLLVVEKPPNIPSQEDASGDLDMLTLLKADLKVRHGKPGNVYLGLVHRLDRPVGGVMVFAKTSKAAARLSEQIRTRAFGKSYLAVLRGTPETPTGALTHYILKDPARNMVQIVDPATPGALEAVLEYELQDQSGDLSLVRVRLHTGRPHQIRVQFAAIGHPLWGDQRYGAELNEPGQQIALWSQEIVCQHPTREETLTFICLPPKIREPWNRFRVYHLE